MFRNRLIVTVCTILLLTGLPFGQALAGTAYAAPAAAPIAAGRAPAQSNSAPPGILSTVDPLPTYSITWTATGEGSSDVTNAGGTRTVASRKITMAGSGIWREYADGVHWDYSPYNLTVTDDRDLMITTPCAYGGSFRTHNTWSITDPGRYTTGVPAPLTDPLLSQPLQHLDGSWYMSDGFIMFAYDHPFNYRDDSDYTDCFGGGGSNTTTALAWRYIDLKLPGELEGDAQGKVFTKNTQFEVVDLYPPATSPSMTVQWNVTVRVLDGRDLTVDRLEVTQGLQDGANTLPLVQGRRTVVRAYLGIGQDPATVPFVTGKLSGYVGSTLLGSVAPFNSGSYGFNGRIDARVDPNWQQIDDTLNFELPYAWTLQPTLRLEVEVNPDHSVAEANYNNNKLSTPMTFLPCSGGVNVTYLPIHYTPPGGYPPADPSANISAAEEFMRKIYPIPDKGLAYFPHSEMALTHSINSTGIDALVLKALQAELLSSSAPRAERIYGWLPSLAYNGNGLGYMPGVAAFGNDTESPDRWRRTFAHEIGHNYGLDHGDLTTAGAHWFDVYDRVIKPVPASVGGKDLLDVMVPDRLESEAWISPVNYEYLVGQICSGGAAAAATTTIQSSATVDTLLVTGIINNTTPATGSLDPLYHFTTVPTDTLPVGSQACINLKDTAGVLLSQYCFDQNFVGDSGTPAGAMPFGMVVPYPPGLKRVELVKGASVLSTQVASAHPPSVTVTYPNAAGLTLSGAQDITWTGTDADGGTLTYNLLYSRDNGATWIGIDNGITGSAYNLDFSGLPGTNGASGKIKVMVSDGFNSAEDISDNPFTVGNKPPVAAIISPPSGAEFTTGPKVVLEGAGMDLENGSLGDSALSWVSSIDGALGTGQLLEVNLSPGVHTITLTATDSGGLTSTASIQITVVQATTIKQVFLPLIMR